eukprot:3090844-Prymnesium_polylepis.1
MAKAELSVRYSLLYGFAIAGDAQRLPAVIKAMRRERPQANRRERRGVRRRHLRAAWKASEGFREHSKDACNEWAAVTTAWQALARAYELADGPLEPGEGRPAGRPTRADLSFGSNKHGRFACLWLRSCKRKNGELAAKVPILFAEGDGMGADTYAALWRMVSVDPCKPGAEASTPLFRVKGKPLK